MARGWESKSIEQQQADFVEHNKSRRPTLSPAEQKCNRIREGLLLARTRLLQMLQSATHSQYRQILERDLAELDRQLSALDPPSSPSAPR